MRACLFLIATLLGGCIGGCSLLTPAVESQLGDIQSGQYRLDPKHASVVFKVNHLGLSSYVGRFNRVSASLDFDPENIQASQFEGRVESASIDTNNRELEQTLCAASWLDCSDYPEARFVSRAVHIENGQLLIDGELTLRDVTRPVQLSGRFIGAARNPLNLRYTLGFEARGKFKRSDFGIDNYLSMIGDEVALEIHAEFVRQ